MALHTDDPDKPQNVDDKTYFAEMQEMADRVGDAGLHVVPEQYLRAIDQQQTAGERVIREPESDA